jgi:hypothetical protein
VGDALNTPLGRGFYVVKESGVSAMMWGYSMTGMGWWMIISSILWLGLVAIAVWAFARWASRPS